MINIIICDDIERDRKKISNSISEYFKTRKIEFKMHLFDDYNNRFLKIIDDRMPSKIYVLDIETPSASGIDIARKIRNKDIDSILIFLTGHDELGNTILKNNLMFLSFINKFDDVDNRVKDALNLSLNVLNKRRTIMIKEKDTLFSIEIDDILYITTDSYERKTVIKTDYSEIKVGKSLTDVREMLDDRFIQTHRCCYINNDRKVKVDISNRIITFDCGEKIDLLSDTYKKEVVC